MDHRIWSLSTINLIIIIIILAIVWQPLLTSSIIDDSLPLSSTSAENHHHHHHSTITEKHQRHPKISNYTKAEIWMKRFNSRFQPLLKHCLQSTCQVNPKIKMCVCVCVHL